MALLFSFLPLLKFLSLMAPSIVSLFILFGSLINQNLKGIIYLSGLILTLIFGILLKPFFGGKIPTEASNACNLYSDAFPNSQWSSPCLDTLSLVFTAIYLLSAMMQYKTLNWSVIVSLFLITGLNGLFRYQLHCNKSMDIIVAVLVGILTGVGYYSLVSIYGGEKYLFFATNPSNKTVCNKPSDQKFKCVVYKNGEIIQQL